LRQNLETWRNSLEKQLRQLDGVFGLIGWLSVAVVGADISLVIGDG